MPEAKRAAIGIRLEGEADFAAWRQTARSLIQAGVEPGDVVFSTAAASADLLACAPPPAPPQTAAPFTVPKAFVALAQDVICHRDRERFALLYRLLWRLTHEGKRLLADAADADVARANAMAKAVGRDKHKMKAFVRFREVADPAGPHFIAWFEPDHHIVEATAGFFARRFTNMRWSILTPRASVHWDGRALVFAAGASQADVPGKDRLEEAWRRYYASIFNPARLKTKAMTSEMPKKYWKNLPEAPLIKPLIAQAEARSRRMIASGPTQPTTKGRMTYAKPETAAATSLEQLKAEAARCTACPLHEPATQTVFGEGPEEAGIMLVGEQPGDQEDLAGRPFVGPAGQVLDRALAQAGLDRSAAYATNAVKHFKFVVRGKRRIHAKPNAMEIKACSGWLERETELIDPAIVIALGATAAEAVLGRKVAISRTRGAFIHLRPGSRALVTVHPSYLLRIDDADRKADEFDRFVADLKLAAEAV